MADLAASYAIRPAGLLRQERSGRISRCSLEAGPILQAAVWLNRYAKYWQQQFDTVALWLDEIERTRRGHNQEDPTNDARRNT